MDATRPPAARDARVLGDLVARDRRTDATALRALGGERDRSYDYRNLCTTAHKAANFLRHLGVRGGAAATDPGRGTVAVAPDPAPEPLLTVLGTAALGGVARFDPRSDAAARAVVVHVDDVERHDPPPGTKLVAYGGDPADPSVEHWEEGVWSENPAAPPAAVDPGDPVLGADRTYTHAELLAAARTVVDRLSLAPGDEVAVRSSLADPRTVAAGVVAPLLVGGAVVLPADGFVGDAAVGDGPEPRTVAPGDVPAGTR